MKKVIANRGITLIALVITIIVLLILAGITISVTVNSGIVGNAKKASDDTQKAQADEMKKLTSVGKYVDNYKLNIKYGEPTGDGTIDGDDFKLIDDCIKHINGEGIGNDKITDEYIDEIKDKIDLNLDGEITQEDKIILALNLAYPDIIKLPYMGELPHWGDVNLDGKLDDDDIELITQYSTGNLAIPNDQVRLNADANIDGMVKGIDKTIITQHIVNSGPIPVINHF